jgi:multidrug efflux pump subunit AcrB
MSTKKKTFWEFFINNRKFVFVLTLAIIFLGLVSIIFIPKESAPQVDFPIVTISTSYPGASPEDVEKLVTNIIEDEILGLSDIKQVDSNSYEGFSSIIMEFNIGVDKDKKVNDVKDSVSKAKNDLPSDANEPQVTDVSISEIIPVLRFSLSGPYDINQLKEVAEDLKEEFAELCGRR